VLSHSTGPAGRQERRSSGDSLDITPLTSSRCTHWR
jgi:hypothetical protein